MRLVDRGAGRGGGGEGKTKVTTEKVETTVYPTNSLRVADGSVLRAKRESVYEPLSLPSGARYNPRVTIHRGVIQHPRRRTAKRGFAT